MTSKINKKIGILGGGQLGKMLCQAGSKFHLNLHILEKNADCPASAVCTVFSHGDITNYDDVIQFGKTLDILTIEIENVNIHALEDLEKLGVKVYPQPAVINIIKDKGLQKEFYKQNNFPTSDFILKPNADEIRFAINNGELTFPFVQKSRTEGYDGKGVQVINNSDDLKNLLDTPSVCEKLVDIKYEISVIVARNPSREVSSFPIVGMEFHPTANLVEFLYCPIDLNENLVHLAKKTAIDVANSLDIVGLLAVEMFVDINAELWINEVAPRPHNSGHHTIEANYCSQYEQHIRCLLNWPLGDTSAHHAAVMINLLGESGQAGPTCYEGLDDILKMKGVYPHLYGKKTTQSFRKMGHVTIIDKEIQAAIETANLIKEKIKVIANC